MAKQRTVNTRIWSDSWAAGLEPMERYLFLYLITNTYTDLCGIYEIPVKTIASETDIPLKEVEKIMQKFEEDGKVYYIDGWIYLKNFVKHHANNPSVKKGIERSLLDVPPTIIAQLREIDPIAMDTSLGTASIQTAGTKPNLTKPNLTLEEVQTPKDVNKDFFGRGESYELLVKELIKAGIPEPIVIREVGSFINYWTEPNTTGKKLRWEMQKTFEVKRRLGTWFRNAQKFGKYDKQNKYQAGRI